MTVVLVACGGGVGAVLRLLIDGWISQRWLNLSKRRLSLSTLHSFPLGMLIVNLIGCFLLGLIARAVVAGAPSWALPLLGTGLCGALTTFSTFSYDNLMLLAHRAWLGLGLNMVVSLGLGLLAFWVAY